MRRTHPHRISLVAALLALSMGASTLSACSEKPQSPSASPQDNASMQEASRWQRLRDALRLGNTPEEALKPWDSEDTHAEVHGPPLPPDAIVEKAGEISALFPDGEERPVPLGSLAPQEGATPQDLIPRILARGRLIVGVDNSQYLLSFRDALSGELQGFEVDLAREVARDIFGDPSRVDFRFVASNDRLEALKTGRVDAVVRTMTITRDRQSLVEFSTPYLRTHTRLAVPLQSDIQGVQDLGGRSVCITDNSTLLELSRRLAPEAVKLRVRGWADCLLALQQNQVDAIMSDDAILAGIIAQDPHTQIVGESLSAEEYGIAVARPLENPESHGLVRQINATLERLQRDGTWVRLHHQWLGPDHRDAKPYPPQYREEEVDTPEEPGDSGEEEH